MQKTPKMITSKDLAYISDMFNWNITIVKKLNCYLEYINNKDISNEFNNLIKLHDSNCQELIKILEGEKKL